MEQGRLACFSPFWDVTLPSASLGGAAERWNNHGRGRWNIKGCGCKWNLNLLGSSLAVQWLGLRTFTAEQAMSGLGGGRRTSQKNPAPKTNVHTTCPCSKKLLFYILFQCYFYCIILYLYLHFIIIFTQKIKQLLLILRDLFISKKFIVSVFLNMRLAQKVRLAFSVWCYATFFGQPSINQILCR